jgi:hypothetical protein
MRKYHGDSLIFLASHLIKPKWNRSDNCVITRLYCSSISSRWFLRRACCACDYSHVCFEPLYLQVSSYVNTKELIQNDNNVAINFVMQYSLLLSHGLEPCTLEWVICFNAITRTEEYACSPFYMSVTWSASYMQDNPKGICIFVFCSMTVKQDPDIKLDLIMQIIRLLQLSNSLVLFQEYIARCFIYWEYNFDSKLYIHWNVSYQLAWPSPACQPRPIKSHLKIPAEAKATPAFI